MSVLYDLLKEILDRKMYERTDDFDPTVFYPSEVGQCLRKLFLKRIFIENKGYIQFSERTAKQFIVGEAIHKALEDYVKNEYSQKKIETEKQVSYKFLDIEIHGVIDIINHSDKEIIEIKTTSRFYQNDTLKHLEALYRRQLNMYLHEYPNYNGYILIIDRVNGEFIEIKHNYDPDMFLMDIELFRKVYKAYKHYVESNRDPRIAYKEIYSLPVSPRVFECRNCPFYEYCLIACNYASSSP